MASFNLKVLMNGKTGRHPDSDLVFTQLIGTSGMVLKLFSKDESWMLILILSFRELKLSTSLWGRGPSLKHPRLAAEEIDFPPGWVLPPDLRISWEIKHTWKWTRFLSIFNFISHCILITIYWSGPPRRIHPFLEKYYFSMWDQGSKIGFSWIFGVSTG